MDMFSPNQELLLMQAAGDFYGRPSAYSGTEGLFQAVNRFGGLPGNAAPGNSFTATPSIMGGLGLEQFGMPGQLAALAGNAYFSSDFAARGILPMGNAGSYVQALQARKMMLQQQALAKQVSSLDQSGIFNTFRGMAATMGVPFGAEQQQAARQMAGTIAQFAPMLSAVAPGIMDALAGPAGSSQAMASQIMQANRYMLDPYSGGMGFSTESNAALINNIYKDLFSSDNLARMQGIKAGEVGQIYREFASEGLFNRPGNMRNRAVSTLLQMRNEGVDVAALGKAAGIEDFNSLTGNLSNVTNADLNKLRTNDTFRDRLTQTDTQQMKQQLQAYSESLAAIREVFGEQGDPNAPIPKLVQGLKAFSSGQIQRFEGNQLTSMMRDVQALSQMSGKNLNQLFQMQMEAVGMGNAMPGLAGNMVSFAPTALNVGVTSGMAFNQTGAATGFGALSREQAEQGSVRLFTRTLGSETTNMLGALSRIDAAGGFTDKAAGKDLQSILDAARTPGVTTYTAADGTVRPLPTDDLALIRLAKDGGISGMNEASFRMFLGDRTANLRSLSRDPGLQQASMRLVGAEMQTSIARNLRNRLLADETFKDLPPEERIRLATRMGRAAVGSFFDMTAQQNQDQTTRNNIMANALMAESGGLEEFSLEKARTMAESLFGGIEAAAPKFGMENSTQILQIAGNRVVRARENNQLQIRAQSGLNDALSVFGPKGSVLNRLANAALKQGQLGEGANLTTAIAELVGSNVDVEKTGLPGQLGDIARLYNNIKNIEAQISGASPGQSIELGKQLDSSLRELKTMALAVQQDALKYGLVEQKSVFNLQDIQQAKEAATGINKLMDTRVTLAANAKLPITEKELANLAGVELTAEDFNTLGVAEIQQQINRFQNMSGLEGLSDKEKAEFEQFKAQGVKEGLNETQAFQSYRQRRIGELQTPGMKEAAIRERRQRLSELGINTIDKLSPVAQEQIARARRGELSPDREDQINRDINTQFERISGVLSEYRSDPEAVLRGGAFAGQALKNATTAQGRLTSILANYYGGDFAAAYTGKLTTEGRKRLETDNMLQGTPEEREKQLQQQVKTHYEVLTNSINNMSGAAGNDFTSLLTPTQQAIDFKTKTPQGMQAILSAADLLGKDVQKLGFEDFNGLAAIVMSGKVAKGATQEQQQVLDIATGMVGLSNIKGEGITKLQRLNAISGRNFSALAKSLGTTEENVRQYIQGENVQLGERRLNSKQVDELYGLYDTYRKVQERPADGNIENDNSLLRKAEENLVNAANASGIEVRRNDKGELNVAGLLATIERTQSTAEVDKLRKNFATVNKLPGGDVSVRMLAAYSKAQTEAQREIARQEQLNLGDETLNSLVRGMGITDPSSEEFVKLRKSLQDKSPADMRNKQMVGKAFERVSMLKGFDVDADAVTRLQKLSTDPELLKTIKEKNPLFAPESIDQMIRDTRFLELDKMKPSGLTQANYMLQGFESVRGLDVKAEREKEQKNTMKLTGEMTVKGDITGTASFTDIIGTIGV